MKKFKCILGIHNKVKIDSTAFNTIKYIDKCMDQYPEEFETAAKGWRTTIIKKLYSHGDYRLYDLYGSYPLSSYKYNSVCIDCYKCFNITDFEKERIHWTVEFFVEEIRAKKSKKKIAEDIYKEKCRKF